MVRTIKLILRNSEKLEVSLSVEVEPSEPGKEQLVSGEALRSHLKAKQRFHLRNHVHYGHQVNLGHQHANSARVNKRQLLRSPAVEQPADLLEQIVQDRARMIEMHAF